MCVMGVSFTTFAENTPVTVLLHGTVMKQYLREFEPVLHKTERILNQKVGWFLWFIKSHYTWLGILVLMILGGIFLFTVSWIFRYDRYDWWRWKRRAVFRFIRYALTLCAAKILILIM